MSEAYDWADNAKGCYRDAIDALRMEKVSSGECLPLPDRPEEIDASPLVHDVKDMNNLTVYNGDCLSVMPAISGMMDSIVTDPPYGLNFMGRDWDKDVAFKHETWRKCFDLLKPGGHLLAFGGTRTYHRMVCAIEDAGFEIRDCIMWVTAQGFPKSHDVSKAIDKRLGAEGEYGAPKSEAHAGWVKRGRMRGDDGHEGYQRPWMQDQEAVDKNARQYAPATEQAKQWDGWGTALKPAVEPVVVARKPLSEKSIAANVLRHGTGGLNIDACRVTAGEDHAANCDRSNVSGIWRKHRSVEGVKTTAHDQGRWPANLAHDGSDEVVRGFPESTSVGGDGYKNSMFCGGKPTGGHGLGDSGSAARFFYCPKADKDDRLQSKHPTVKPVDLMAWLVRLVTPKGGLVLDPFAGSGSTGMACMREGFRAILIEKEAEHYQDILRRCAHVSGDDTPLFAQGDLIDN